MIEQKIINELKLEDKIPIQSTKSQIQFLEEILEKEGKESEFVLSSFTTKEGIEYNRVIGINLNNLNKEKVFMYSKDKKTSKIFEDSFITISHPHLIKLISWIPYFPKELKERTRKTLVFKNRFIGEMLRNYKESKKLKIPISNISTIPPQREYIVIEEIFENCETELKKQVIVLGGDEILNRRNEFGFVSGVYGTIIKYI